MKNKILKILSIIVFSIFLIPLTVKADTTDNLLIDIKINKDGSLFIRELATLEGSYNGRLRNIEFANPNTKKFTGIASDFAGSDIYNGSSIKDVRIYDVKYNEVPTFDDMNKLNKEFKKVSYGDNGDYGVYELTNTSNGIDLKIFNPSSKNTAFYIEYKVTNAVVVHNDIAELAWNILGNEYEEDITNLSIKITLPSEDKDLRAWLHATLETYGDISLHDNIYTLTIYKNLPSYSPVSIRMMFNKNIVSSATKKSNINGKTYILEYEQKEADKANVLREQAYEALYLDAEEKVSLTEQYLTYEYYKEAQDLVGMLKDTDERKKTLLDRLAPLEELIDIEMIKRAKIEIDVLKKDLTTNNYNSAYSAVSKIINDEERVKLEQELNIIYSKLQKKLLFKRTSVIILTLGFIAGAIMIYKKEKKKNLALSSFDMEYFRDFPSEDGPEVIDYLMNKKISNNSLSAIILDLIRKKAITFEELDNKNKDYIFIKNNEYKKELSNSENAVMSLIFDLVGDSNQVTLNEIKKYGTTESKARTFLKVYNNFVNIATKKAESLNFYETKNTFKAGYVIMYIVISIILAILYVWAEISGLIFITPFLIIITTISILSIKIYTPYGIDQFKKWKAHKKFLMDFGNFKEKELPEITLWEKYLVYATVLGCAKSLQKAMAVHINNMGESINMNDLTTIYIMNSIIRSNIANTVSNAVSSSITTSTSTIAVDTSYSSGGGFGGGSSGGGGSFGGGGGGGRF